MLSNTQKEDREFKRFLLNVQVFDSKTNEHIGDSINLHSEGMMLKSKKQLSINSEYKIVIRHHQLDDDIVEIPIIARCLWSNPVKNPNYYHSGFQFINPSPRQIMALDDLVWDLATL